jgi:hypothetical protein
MPAGRPWTGVECNGNGRVMKLKLLGLVGELSDMLMGTPVQEGSSETNTPGQDQAGGRFEGTVPSELGSLKELEELWLNMHRIRCVSYV